jgi:hypothetical protein
MSADAHFSLQLVLLWHGYVHPMVCSADHAAAMALADSWPRMARRFRLWRETPARFCHTSNETWHGADSIDRSGTLPLEQLCK